MKDIFKGTISEAKNIKNLLENIDIEVFVTNEMMANIEPWVVTAGGYNPVSLKVNEKDFEKASKLIGDYNSGELEI
jgi:hypothetical protein